MTSKRIRLVLLVAAMATGCGGDGNDGQATNLGEKGATTSSAAAGTTSSVATGAACEVQGGVSTKGSKDVAVELSEWKIIPDVAQVAPGIVSFLAENTGKDPHELVIVKGDSAEALPKGADGGMDEEKLPAGALVGEIEPMDPAQLCRGNFTMTAGSYVLLCNIVEEEGGEHEAHFAEGMYTDFTVR